MTDFDPYDDDALLAEAQQDVRREQMARRLRLLLDRRPPVFADEGELHSDVCGWIDRFLEGDPGSLLLFGAVGTGKTWSLWKTAETLIRRGWRGRFEIAPFYEVKEATDRPVDTERIRTWRDADLFALDEIGAQRVNDWDADALSAIIDRRWQQQRPTLVTSNEPNLRDLLGGRAASRLADGATIVDFTGTDRRRAR
jgi:DNA replication protein DnaC